MQSRSALNTTEQTAACWLVSNIPMQLTKEDAVLSCTPGIKPCPPASLDPTTGNCTFDPAYPGWNSIQAFATTLVFYRVNATLAADRQSNTVLEISGKSDPVPQTIPSEDFLESFNRIICPFIAGNSTQTSSLCMPGGLNNFLTSAVCSRIVGAASAYRLAVDDAAAVGILRNLFATALLLFNPATQTMLLSGKIQPSETMSGLPAENTFLGSPARHSTYVAPASWTVVAFTVSTVVLIGGAAGALLLSMRFDTPDSSFPLVDATKVSVSEPRTGREGSLESVIGKPKSDEDVISAARGLKVRLVRTPSSP